MTKRFTTDLARMAGIPRVEKDLPKPPFAFVQPQSLRHLPVDIENELRVACSMVVSSTTSAEPEEHSGRKRATTLFNKQQIVKQMRSPGLDSHPVHSHEPVDQCPKAGLCTRLPLQPMNANVGDRVLSGVVATEERPNHARSKSSSAYLSVAVPKTYRPRMAHRRDSSRETTHSTYQSDATDDNAASTAMTSVAISPAHISKRTSAQARKSQEKTACRPDSQDLEDMRKKLDMHRMTREEQEHGHSAIFRKLSKPTRKPVVPIQHTVGSVENLIPKDTASQPIEEIFSAQHPPAGMEEPERTGRTSARARAASGARSLSRGLRELWRPSSRHNNDRPASRKASRPSTSRDRDGGRRQSKDWLKRGWRTSVDSLLPPAITRAYTDRPTSSKVPHRPFSQQVLGGLNRPKSSGGSATPYSTQDALDLNRRLPPLPRLDTWKGDDDVVRTGLQSGGPSIAFDSAQPSTALSISAAAAAPNRPYNDECPVSPMTLASRTGFGTLSAWPEMSATFCPGDYELDGPMRTPSPISESSLKRSRSRSEVQVEVSQEEVRVADEDDVSSPVTPMVAHLVSRLSSGNLKAQLVHNISRPQTRPTSAKTSTPRLDTLAIPLLPSPLTMSLLDRELPPEPISSEHDGRIFSDMFANAGSEAKPIILLRKKTKKSWWKAAARSRQRDWMTDVEHSSSRSGVLMFNEAAAAPIVRYS